MSFANEEEADLCALSARVALLENAIRQHRDERGDDRCHADDARLYAVIPEGDTRPAVETAVTLENCAKYIECRQTGRVYVSPQRRIEELEIALGRSDAQAEKFAEIIKSIAGKGPEVIEQLEADVLRLQKLAEGLAARCAGQSELLTSRAMAEADKCEHGVDDGMYCKPCNEEVHRARREAGIE